MSAVQLCLVLDCIKMLFIYHSMEVFIINYTTFYFALDTRTKVSVICCYTKQSVKYLFKSRPLHLENVTFINRRIEEAKWKGERQKIRLVAIVTRIYFSFRLISSSTWYIVFSTSLTQCHQSDRVLSTDSFDAFIKLECSVVDPKPK